MLTKEEKLRWIRKAKEGEDSYIMGARISTWNEDGVEITGVLAHIDFVRGQRTIYTGTYEDCKEWLTEIQQLWQNVRDKYLERELEEYRDLGIDI